MQKGTVLPHLLERHGNGLFVGFMLGAVAFLFLIDSVFNGGIGYAMKALWLPLAVLIFGATWWYRLEFYRLTRSRWKPWIVAVLLYPLALLMSWPYLMVVNAATAPGHKITYAGPVVHKWVSSGRLKQHLLVVHDQATGQRVTLPVSDVKYNSLAVGATWQESFTLGGLGIPFRWRYSQ